MDIVNCTPHSINVSGVEFPPSGIIPRVTETATVIGNVAVGDVDIDITEIVLGNVENLPDPKLGVYYVVSRITAEAVRDRRDLLIPGKQIRDENGRIIGCETLSRLPL